MKTLVMTGMIIGSYGGGYLPVLWGDSFFSLTSVLTSTIGGFVGIYVGFKTAQRFGF